MQILRCEAKILPGSPRVKKPDSLIYKYLGTVRGTPGAALRLPLVQFHFSNFHFPPSQLSRSFDLESTRSMPSTRTVPAKPSAARTHNQFPPRTSTAKSCL